MSPSDILRKLFMMDFMNRFKISRSWVIAFILTITFYLNNKQNLLIANTENSAI